MYWWAQDYALDMELDKMGSYQETKEWRRANPDKVAAQARRYRRKHPDKVKLVKDRYREKTKDTRLPIEAAQKMVNRLNDPISQRRREISYNKRQLEKREELAGRPRAEKCELCGKPAKTVFDHCHISGKFRGWICDRCNRTLGSVKDSIELLKKMILYLKRSAEKGVL